MGNIKQQAERLWAFLTEPPKQPLLTSPLLDRACIAFLAIDWIAFGSMHFSLHNETLRMLPSWVPFGNCVVVVSGMAEVCVGLLLLYRRCRRFAALGSLLLLVLFMPSVFQMLYQDASLPFADAAPLASRIWRTLLIPHNVLMAICSLHLLRKPYADPWDDFEEPPSQRVMFGRAGATLMVAFVLLLCNAAGFLALLAGINGHVLPIAAMWMMMCLAVGGLLGFIFAVPRANSKVESRELLQPNRNIEAVSDWLTKIIIGLGLINFKDIGAWLSKRAEVLAPVLDIDPNFVVSLIVFFTIAGFLEGYLLTRMYLQWYFQGTPSGPVVDDDEAKATIRISRPPPAGSASP